MTDVAEKKLVLQAGDKFKFTDPWGNQGRGVYLGSQKVFSLKSGEIFTLDSDVKVELDDTDTEIQPVLVVNESRIKLSTIAVGVFLGNLISGIIVVIFALMLGALK